MNINDFLHRIPKYQRDHLILFGFRGSISHGTYVPNTDPNSIDDVDFMGVSVPELDRYFGLMEFGSRGTVEIKQDELDVVIYEVRKMISLLAQGNPNVLSLLWLPEGQYISKASGDLLIENRSLFLSKRIYNTFVGYAYSQLERMNRFEHHGYMGEKRKKLVEKHGYDTKNASHLIRLLRMGIETLETGELRVFRNDAEELIAIKHGEWSLDRVKSTAQKYFETMQESKNKSILPEEPDMEAINQLCVKIVKMELI